MIIVVGFVGSEFGIFVGFGWVHSSDLVGKLGFRRVGSLTSRIRSIVRSLILLGSTQPELCDVRVSKVGFRCHPLGFGSDSVLDLGFPSGFGFFRVLKNDYNLPKIYTFKAIFSLQKYSVLKNRPILIVFHAGKVEKRDEEKF